MTTKKTITTEMASAQRNRILNYDTTSFTIAQLAQLNPSYTVERTANTVYIKPLSVRRKTAKEILSGDNTTAYFGISCKDNTLTNDLQIRYIHHHIDKIHGNNYTTSDMAYPKLQNYTLHLLQDLVDYNTADKPTYTKSLSTLQTLSRHLCNIAGITECPVMQKCDVKFLANGISSYGENAKIKTLDIRTITPTMLQKIVEYALIERLQGKHLHHANFNDVYKERMEKIETKIRESINKSIAKAA
ncbi:MAG: hypothetical protein RR370_01710 [Synergistaceae bacterium]